jgi:hypothetical protein
MENAPTSEKKFASYLAGHIGNDGRAGHGARRALRILPRDISSLPALWHG